MAEPAWKPHPGPAAPAIDTPEPSGARRSCQVGVQMLPNDVVLLTITGVVDARASAELERQFSLGTRMSSLKPPQLLLDLSGVTFLDHAGLDALLGLEDRLRSVSGTVELLAPSPSVVRLLHEADLDGQAHGTTSHHSPLDQPLF